MCLLVSGGGVGGLLGGPPLCWVSPPLFSLLSSLLSSLSSPLSPLLPSPPPVVSSRGGSEVVVVAHPVGGGCASENFALGAQSGPSRNNGLLSRDTAGVNVELTIDARPLGRDAGLKRLRASSNAEKQTKFTSCEFKFEIQQRLSSLVDNPSQGIFYPSKQD